MKPNRQQHTIKKVEKEKRIKEFRERKYNAKIQNDLISQVRYFLTLPSTLN